ncbi:DUF6429 family protein [Caulobacter sp. NIBR1757]|uniref:DUF6429 family protein n=1 Tax=Caulobacter sp. NIBR1757 TaxID=3016000 RepID=UPI0022F0BF37|nr:DUF6429 family protein [Caulobacter sp. NIBR1757]WGM38919.1 hypothetical protein AMEJIAPC_01829 [Caulobacter sp. NIBR1757]
MPKKLLRPAIDREALDAAQEIAFDAMEAATPAKRKQLARKALSLSPFCSDGYLVLGEEASDPAGRIDLFSKAVEVGRAALDPDLAAEGQGQLWMFIEARPYMRALHSLAVALGEAGMVGDAIPHCELLLRLNEGDNQGIRYILMDFLLMAGRDADAQALWSRFAEDDFAAWTWSAVLLGYRAKAPDLQARLKRARTSNSHVEAYLTGGRKLPKDLPPYYSPGEPSEAISYAFDARKAWSSTPGALEWLRGPTPKRPKRRDDDAMSAMVAGDPERIDRAVLALLLLGLHGDGRVWKSHDWGTLDRLHDKGWITDPVGKAKSVVMTDDGLKAATDAFNALFGPTEG